MISFENVSEAVLNIRVKLQTVQPKSKTYKYLATSSELNHNIGRQKGVGGRKKEISGIQKATFYFLTFHFKYTKEYAPF